jgi:hypothetical protein
LFHKRIQWLEARENELLPVPYFHTVFTLPEQLNTLAMHKPKIVYDTLFEAAWLTLSSFAKGNKMGMISILHTWGQSLTLHPHIHCIIPGGYIDSKGQWYFTKSNGKFLFPVKALSKVFKSKYLAILRNKINRSDIPIDLYEKAWVVYAKKPFGSPKSVIEYLGRYTHKVAISNHRILKVDLHTITFSYKDYKCGAIQKNMTLTHQEFIRRFAQHILPKRFVRIRHFGFLSSSWKKIKLPALIKTLNVENHVPPSPKLTSKSLHLSCPLCKSGKMHVILMFGRRGPPIDFAGWAQNSNSSNHV